MGIYRLKRNIVKSLLEYFRAALTTDNWQGIAVEKFLKREDIPIPAIIIYVSDINDTKHREIGGNKYLKFPTVMIRIFAKDEGSREDLSDWVMEKLEDNLPYYEYTKATGGTIIPTQTGYINVVKILKDEKELANTDPENLDKRDRYRHRIEFTCFVGEI